MAVARRPRQVIALTLLLLAVGCASPRVNWEARVGVYTYDQAVLDLGPPDKSAKLGDGTQIADWLLRRGYVYTQSFGYSHYPWYEGPFASSYITSPAPDHFLRLVFDANGRLRSHRKYYR